MLKDMDILFFLLKVLCVNTRVSIENLLNQNDGTAEFIIPVNLHGTLCIHNYGVNYYYHLLTIVDATINT